MPRLLPTLLGPHRVDSKFLLTFLGLTIGLLGMFWLGSEVLEGDTFALDKLILRGLRTDRDPGLPIGPVWLKATAIDITALDGVTVLTSLPCWLLGISSPAAKPTCAVRCSCHSQRGGGQ